MSLYSRVPFVLWLPVFAGSVAGGWMLGSHAGPGVAHDERPPRPLRDVASPAVAGSRNILSSGIHKWIERVKGAGPESFPAFFAELKDLFPDEEERRESALSFLFSEWMGKDVEAALAFAMQDGEERSLLDTALKVLVRVCPEKAAALVFAAGDGKLSQNTKEAVLSDFAECYPALYLKRDVLGKTLCWSGAVEALAKRDPAAAAKAWLSGGERQTKEERARLAAVLAGSWQEQDSAAARSWAEKLPDEFDRKSAVNAWLAALAEKDPRAALNELASCSKMMGTGEVPGSDARVRIAERWAQTDFAEAMAMVRELAGYFPREGDAVEPSSEAVNELREQMLRAKGAALPSDPAGMLSELDNVARVIDPQYDGKHFPEEMDDEFFFELDRQIHFSPAESLAAARLRLARGLSGEHDLLLSRLLCRAGTTDPAAVVAMVQELPETMRAGIAVNLIEESVKPEQTEEMAALLQQLSPGDWSGDLIMNLGEHLPNYAPMVAALSGEGSDQARAAYAESWAQHDPAAAAAWVNTLTTGRADAVAGLAEGWAGYDEVAASAWAASLEPGSVRDNAAVGLSAALSVSDPASAWQWAASISGRGVRRKAMTTLAEAWEDAPPEFREACAAEGIAVEAESAEAEDQAPANPFASP